MAKGDVRTVAMSTKGGSIGEQAVVGDVVIDFTGLDRDQLIDLAMPGCKIDVQRVFRSMARDSVMELVSDGGYRVHALNCGKKPVTEAERKAQAKALIASLSPEKLAELMAELQQ